MDLSKDSTSKRVRLLRNDLGLSQAEVGQRVGVAKSTISGIERGTQGISGVADKLAKALGTTTDYLFGLSDNPLPADDNELDEPDRDPLRDALLAEYDRLDEIDRQVLYQMAVTLRLARERRRSQRVIE